MRPWYLRWWGIAALIYLGVTGLLGGWLFVASRRVSVPRASPEGVLRTKEFTEATSDAVPVAIDPKVSLVTEDDPSLGPADAVLTIVEFSDFQCPYCRRAFPIIREVAARYGKRLRVIYRDFPVDALHESARRAAEAGQCAHAQGKFWAYHDKLFTNADLLDDASLRKYARAVGLDGQKFDVCLAAGQFSEEVAEDVAVGRQLGVRGTPTWFFVLGTDTAHARRVEGVISREALVRVLDRFVGSPQ